MRSEGAWRAGHHIANAMLPDWRRWSCPRMNKASCAGDLRDCRARVPGAPHWALALAPTPSGAYFGINRI